MDTKSRLRVPLALLTFLAGLLCPATSLSAPACLLSTGVRQSPARSRPPCVANRPLTLFVAGDVLLGRGVETPLRRKTTALTALRREIQSVDLAFCNLECTLSDEVPGARRVRLLAHPAAARYLDGLRVVSLANNHALDAGEGGLRTTLAALQRARIAGIGAATGSRAWEPWETTVRGRRIAWIAASEWGPFRSGSARVRPIEGSKLIEQVRALASRHETVIVSLHWGNEYSPEPTSGQISTAHALIDAGVSAVVGHHPHVAQPLEIYRGRPIFYSLGNFVFDTVPGKSQNGLAEMLSIDNNGMVRFKTVPVPNTRVPVPTPPTLPGEQPISCLLGHFARGDQELQMVTWTRRHDGIHVLRAFGREASGWRCLAVGFHPAIEDVQVGDVDAAGRDELVVGLCQRSRLDTHTRHRLHVYEVDSGHGFRPRWRGSALSRPFTQFRLMPASRGCALVALEKSPLPEYRDSDWLAIYHWDGFGFRLAWDTPVRGKIAGLSTGVDGESSYIRFTQVLPTGERVLIVRPVPGSKDEEFQVKQEQASRGIQANDFEIPSQ